MPKFSKGHNFFFLDSFQKLTRSSTYHLVLACQVSRYVKFFLRYLAYKIKMPKFSKNHNSCKQFRIFFFQKFIRSSICHSLSACKVPRQ